MNSRSDFEAKIRLALGLVVLFGIALLLLHLLLPWLLLGGGVGVGYWLWQRQQIRQFGQNALQTAFPS
ncbi:hypothetical protein IQ241_09285 [Romeria aff. gracilis LEGE 07310]|uniref:Uncharacterized protein n=1 Tax=Vasconcelosia minhoensis LEGE 07310 TaxID=915328 RepID=A0A8J7AH70_9CYAN|nr:hypothetical protein [Romeria gracilis]MBE9077488.1 hypothetical protein [Romeria aff. gracilis LEGE 07310]